MTSLRAFSATMLPAFSTPISRSFCHILRSRSPPVVGTARNTLRKSLLPPSRAYSTPPQGQAPSVDDSAADLAAHLKQYPEKLDYMAKVVAQQLASIRQEVERKDEHYEAAEATAVLNALASTLDTLMPAVTEGDRRQKLEGLKAEIVILRTSL